MTARLSPQEALVYTMITTSAVDRAMTDDELSRIGSGVPKSRRQDRLDVNGFA